MNGIRAGIRFLCFLILLAILVVISVQIVMRYLFNNSLLWVEEFAKFGLAWLGFLGVGLAVMTRTHAEVDFFLKKLPGHVGNKVAILVLVICDTFFLFLIYYGIELGFQQFPVKSPILKWSMAFQFLAAPVSAMFIVLDLTLKIFRSIQENSIFSPKREVE